MPPRLFLVVLLFLSVVPALSALAAHAVAQEQPAPPTPESSPTSTGCCDIHLTLDSLVRMSRCELESLYCRACPAPMLDGCYRGKSIRWAGSCLAVPDSKLTGCLWKGKHFDSCSGTLVNQWCGGVEKVHANVYCGESWLDGKPSLIMDYRGSSPVVWHNGRDELREICPGLYLGVMFKDKCPQPKFVRFFALECAAACTGK
jgi:hypothetical protein